MSTFLPAEKGSTIRQPSVANLMIDSADRPPIFPSAGRFQITKSQSILNGFFTRIASSELVFEWNLPNISADLSNNTFTVDVSGTTYTVTLQTQFYTVQKLLDVLVYTLNLSPSKPAGVTWVVAPPGNALSMAALACNAPYSVLSSPLAIMLFGNVVFPLAPTIARLLYAPDLRPFRYIDITSQQITYNQDLKDAATNKENRDVLARWYMDYDNPPAVDAYGYPILMGYSGFCLRRLFSPPKQIRWESNMPVGNIAFELYIDDYSADFVYNFRTKAFPENQRGKFDWLLTAQVSEN